MKRLLLCALASLAPLIGSAVAGPYYAVPGMAQAPQPRVPAPSTPDQILRRGIERLGGFLARPEATDPARVRAFLDREIAGYFDFHSMSRWAAGPYFRRMNERQRERFSDKLRDMFLGALARNLGTFARPLPRIAVYSTRSDRWGDELTVRARVMPPSRLAINLDFRFYRTASGWKVFDITANGASAVTYYRRYFAAQVRAGGRAALYN